jgi:hypothetical protein
MWLSLAIKIMALSTQLHALEYLPHAHDMAGPATNLVQVFRTGRAVYLEFLRLWTGFELPSSCVNLPCCASNRNRNSFCVMSR